MTGRIDDPVDASFDGWPDEPDDLGQTLADLALRFSSLIFPPAKVLAILKDRFLPSSRAGRVAYLLNGLRIKLDRLESETKSKFDKIESESSDLRDALKALQSKIEAPAFEEAVAVACEEAARAIDLQKVEQFASILVGSLVPEPWHGPSEDVATMIRDIAQLGETDILVLRGLESAFGDVGGPNFNLVNGYTGNMHQLREAVRKSRLHLDDFYAVCARLSGFGLAIEEPRNISRMEPHEHCFRPTHRGKTLLLHIDAAEAASRPKEQAAG